jgi:carotenoid cleavage dioxygenase
MGNYYLQGNYAPVRREHMVTELAVTGAIPAHLDGRYLRHRPNPDGRGRPRRGVRLRPHCTAGRRGRWATHGFVYAAGTGRSDLATLDAATLETTAAIHLPIAARTDFTVTGRPVTEQIRPQAVPAPRLVAY